VQSSRRVPGEDYHYRHETIFCLPLLDQPNIPAKELSSNYIDTPDSIDFTRWKSVASIISRECTAVLTTKLKGVVLSDSTSSFRELCDRLWCKHALDRHNSGEECLDIFKAYVISAVNSWNQIMLFSLRSPHRGTY
jgi:hypothetical protein